MCKSAPRPSQVTMPASHRSVFYRLDALPAANQQHQSTEGKSYKGSYKEEKNEIKLFLLG